VATTVACLLAANPLLDISYRHVRDGREFVVTAGDLRRRLDGVSLSAPAVFSFVREYVASGVEKLHGGAGVFLG